MHRAVRTFLGRLREIRPDISGADLLRAGVRPGPAVSRGLDAALVAKLDGKAPGPSAQLRIALSAVGRS